MKTYEDLLELRDDEKLKGEFCADAVRMFQSSKECREAMMGEAYYNKHNETIEQFVKWLYTVSGRKIEDVYSANYKLKTLFFRRMVIQQVQYLLGNGINLKNQKNKDKLGKDFDFKVQQAGKLAMAGGRSFGYWNHDHLEVFGYACTDKHAGFCPIYSENTAELMAGIRYRFKKVNSKIVARYTLFEIEGITEYQKSGNDDVECLESRKAYKTTRVVNEAQGVVDVMEEGYNGKLPIVPLYANDTFESELVGVQESIDCYDLIKSGLANNIDDASEIYWIVKNAGGMDDPDLAKFMQRIKTTKIVDVDTASDGGVEAHEVNVPVEARKTMLELLRSDIYEDMMLVDMKTLSASQKTTQEIQSAYQMMDGKVDDFEYYVLDFLDSILELAGMPNEEVTLIRNKVANQAEQTQMVLSAGQYLTPECIIKHIPWLTSDEQEEEIKRLDEKMFDQFNAKEEPEEEEEQPEGDE